MRPEALEIFQQIRDIYRRPMIVTSGYRDKTHPIEAEKAEPGEHYYGLAADFKVYGVHAMELVNIAYNLGIRRIGQGQRYDWPLEARFIHLGIGDQYAGFSKGTWSY